MQYVWLIWSLVILGLWAAIYLVRKDFRKIMLPVSLLTMLFGLTEPLFVPEYWSPPSLFDLAEKTGFDIESFIFSFAIGGIGAVLYNVVFPSAVVPLDEKTKSDARHRFHLFALFTPFAVFPVLAVGTNLNHIYCGIIALFAGTLATVFCRPDLTRKILIGGTLFLILYFFYFGSILIFYPEYIKTVWNLDALSRLFVVGIPVEELLFAFTFGMYWSGVYEHFAWQAVGGKNREE
jgi:hypothetical protein